MNLRLEILLMTACAVLIGCDETRPEPRPVAAVTAAQTEPAEQVAIGNGVIKGTVQFVGTAPTMRAIKNRPCHTGAKPIVEESIVVNDGKLQNVIVYVKGAAPADGSSADPALLDQVDCRYTPHVVAVQTGQPLRIRSSDPTIHNVHYDPQLNAPSNFGMTSAGSERTVTFKAPEFIRVRCDVHPWMNAYIGVFENSLFAVTNAAGEFEITGIPPGAYTLTSWHEQLGEIEQAVEISDDATVEVEMKYEEP